MSPAPPRVPPAPLTRQRCPPRVGTSPGSRRCAGSCCRGRSALSAPLGPPDPCQHLCQHPRDPRPLSAPLGSPDPHWHSWDREPPAPRAPLSPLSPPRVPHSWWWLPPVPRPPQPPFPPGSLTVARARAQLPAVPVRRAVERGFALRGGGQRTGGSSRGPPERPLPLRTSGHTPCAWSSVRICLVTTTNTEVPCGTSLSHDPPGGGELRRGWPRAPQRPLRSPSSPGGV